MAIKKQKYVVTAKIQGKKRDNISQPLDKKNADEFAKAIKDNMKMAIPVYKVFSDIKVELAENKCVRKKQKLYKKEIGENKMAKKKKENLDEGMVMMASLLPVGDVVGFLPKRKDNFKFKGLPGQFNENGEKVLDEEGNKIKVKEEQDNPIKVVVKEEQDYKYYKNLLADVEDGLNELVNIGEDGSVFKAPKHAHKSLKQAYTIVNKIK